MFERENTQAAAVDDEEATDEDTLIIIAPLTNDRDGKNNPLTLVSYV